MSKISKWTMALVLLSGAAYGQVPSTNDTSDLTYFNTGMGTGTLLRVTPSGNYCGISTGSCNTASGYQALNFNTTGGSNTASGFEALYGNTTGFANTAVGAGALGNNTVGSYNTASGYSALISNTSGISNTVSGYQALGSNTTGSYNTATGLEALYNNTIGNQNTASGYAALFGTSTSGGAIGSNNTASGYQALYSYSTGSNNTAAGMNALYANTTGSINTANGQGALQRNTTGWGNTATGQSALGYNTTGAVNIGLGYQAGSKVTTGSHNIEIGNLGAASDNNIIKIGTEGEQAKTFIAGIYNTSVAGSAVMVNSIGQLGVMVSSERFKTRIAPMGSGTEKLEQLRPVTFRLKTDAKGTVQYGLIAEEVAKVYPELVIRDETGRIDSVRYDELAPMLLNEVQKEQRINSTQSAKIASLEQQLAVIQAALLKLQSKDELVARSVSRLEETQVN